jgi:hypothetical protein
MEKQGILIFPQMKSHAPADYQGKNGCFYKN